MFAPHDKWTLNLANPLTIDFQTKFNTAPAGGESLQLDWYSVAIKRAG